MQNLVPYNFEITKKIRNQSYKHSSFLIWFTGLSGSGKSTIANKVEQELYKKGIKTYILDADDVRKGVCRDLSFVPEDRTENVRRISEIASLLIDAGIVVLAAFVSPYKKDRINIKDIVKDVNFVEIFVNTSIVECERRDVKGLYKKARAGEIEHMTGISAPYEAPENPAIEIKTEEETIDQAVKRIMDYITPKLELKNE